jgi:protein-S-isoprenylcysteine O-methyltransferase Ste14
MRRLLRSTLFWTIIGAIVGAAAVLIAPGLIPSALSTASTPGQLLRVLDSIGLPWPILVSAVVWTVFSLYWEAAARKASARQQGESSASRAVHVVLTSVAQALLLLPVPGLRARFLPPGWPGIVVGFALELAGLVLAIWARRVLGRHWSGAIATNAGHELIRSGPYQRLRHPIYSGLLLLYLGTALVSGELHGLLGFVLAVVAYWRKIRLEEAHLEQLFGPDYAAYQKVSWAVVPWIF